MVFAKQNICALIVNLIFKRVAFLFAMGAVVFFFLVNAHTLKIKTLNYLVPPSASLRVFANQPEKLSREELKSFLIYYKKVCEFVPNDPEEPAPCGLMAYVYYYLGETDKAIDQYKRVSKLNHQFFWFYYNLGVIYYNEQDYAQAAEYFARAANTPPEGSMYFFMLTKTYKDIARLLNITAEDFEKSLNRGYEQARKLYLVSQLFVDKPQLKNEVERQRINLKMF